MKIKSTVLLAVLLVLLCAGYWAAQQWGQHAQREAVERKRVFAFEAEAVRFLEIERIDEKPTAATRSETGSWTITEPNPTIPAFAKLWERVAQHLAMLSNERTIVEHPEDLAQYGLDRPVLTVCVETRDGAAATLSFGYLEPTQIFRYARCGEGPLFLVHADQFYELDRPLSLLRDTAIVDDPEASILRLEFARIWTGRGVEAIEDVPGIGEESVVVAVERADAHAPWALIQPVAGPADQAAVAALVKELQFAVGRAYIDSPGPLADYGLDPPNLRITLQDDGLGRAQNLFLGELDSTGEVGGLYAKREGRGAVFIMDANIMTLIPETPTGLRERHLLTRQVSGIRSLEYRSREAAFVLEKADSGSWRMVQPEQDDTDQAAVSGFLSALKSLEGQAFFEGDLAAFGLDAPAVAITLTYEGEAPPAFIRLTPNPEQPLYYYGTQDTGHIAQVYTNQVERLLVDANTFRSRELLRFVKAHAVRLEFEFEGTAYALDKVHGKWLVTDPPDKTLANQADVETLLDALNPLHASSAVQADPPLDPGAYGLDSPLLRLFVSTRADPAGAEIRLGPVTVGQSTAENSQWRYAAVGGRDGVFTVRQDLIEAVREALRGVTER